MPTGADEEEIPAAAKGQQPRRLACSPPSSQSCCSSSSRARSSSLVTRAEAKELSFRVEDRREGEFCEGRKVSSDFSLFVSHSTNFFFRGVREFFSLRLLRGEETPAATPSCASSRTPFPHANMRVLPLAGVGGATAPLQRPAALVRIELERERKREGISHRRSASFRPFPMPLQPTMLALSPLCSCSEQALNTSNAPRAQLRPLVAQRGSTSEVACERSLAPFFFLLRSLL